jgi:hypothetical protein
MENGRTDISWYARYSNVNVASRAVRVTVSTLASVGDLHKYDIDVLGVYLVLVPAELSDARAANCARDGLKSTISVEEPDMFNFEVTDLQTGALLHFDGELKEYALEDKCLGVTLL